MIKDKKVETTVFVQAIVETLTGHSKIDIFPLFYVLKHIRSLFALCHMVSYMN